MGDYRPAVPEQEYPPDLASYPDGEGWMNEEAMRIGMQHRLARNDENLIRPSPIPTHERRDGYNHRRYVFRVCLGH